MSCGQASIFTKLFTGKPFYLFFRLVRIPEVGRNPATPSRSAEAHEALMAPETLKIDFKT